MMSENETRVIPGQVIPGQLISGQVIPGEVLVGDDPVILFDGRATTSLTVHNLGDRPIQVGSHYHFAEVNPALSFDRDAARGFKLAIPAGTSVRFEPGIERTVDLVALAGNRVVPGLRGETAGPVDGSTEHGATA